MNLKTRLINQTLTFKLNALLVAMLVVLMSVIWVVISVNFQSLLSQSGRENIEQDVDFVQRRIVELETDIQTTARLLSNSPSLVTALNNGDTSRLRASIVIDATKMGLDYIEILDANQNFVLNQSNTNNERDKKNKALIELGMLGIESTALIHPAGSDDQVVLIAITPVTNSSGIIVGSLAAGVRINQTFLNRLNLQRQAPHIGFIYEGAVVARNFTEGAEFTGLNQDQTELSRVMKGEVLIIEGEDTADVFAYTPITVGDTIQAVIGIERDFETLKTFQSRLTNTTALVVAGVTISLVAIVAFFVWQSITQPINRLKIAAEQMAAGDLSQRAHISSKDEIGRLGLSFNSMAEQIKNLFALLNERVVETEAARQRAEHSDKVKSSFLASMSHELRTPLNAVINFTKFVAKGQLGPVNQEQQETLYEVVDSAKHLLNLINDVLDMSKIESGTLTLFVVDNVDMGSIVNQVCSTGKGLLADKPVEIHSSIEEDLPRIRGDRQRLVQIFLNIMSNACKFTEEGTITVKAYRRDDDIVIAMTDTGPGIAPEDLSIVFEAFKQTESGLRQGGGTGLGMPITKNLVEAHGGHIGLESQPGKGTTFMITLPITSTILEPTLMKTRSIQ
jgi:signal transduction histidine kinase